MLQFERDLRKKEHPFGIDGFWWGWISTTGHYWSLKTIAWTGRQPKEYKHAGLPRHLTEEDVKEVARGKFVQNDKV